MPSLDDIVSFGKGLGSGVGGAAKGTLEGLKDLAKGGYALVSDAGARDSAWNAAKGAAEAARQLGGEIADRPEQVYQRMSTAVGSALSAADRFRQTATPEQWGEVTGGGAFNVAALLAPIGAFSRLGQAAELTEAADLVGEARTAAAAFPKAAVAPVADCPLAAKSVGPLAEEGMSALEELAARPGAAEDQLIARQKLAANFLDHEGGLEPDRRDELMAGIDLTKPLEIVDIPPPPTMVQWVRTNSGKIGNWFNPDPTQTPEMLGLNGDPTLRRAATFKTPPGKALKSIANPIVDKWTDPMNPISTPGGGVQMFVPDEVRNAFKEVP